MPGLDPLSFAPAAIGLIGGGIQAILGGGKQRRAIKALEKLQTPTYAPNKAVSDYYQTALNRYNTSPYQSAEYKYALQRNQQNQANALSALGSRRSALAGAAAIVNAGDNADAKAGIQAEGEQRANLGILGNATGMKVADDRMAFNQNVLAPYQKKFGLLSQKAAAGGQQLNAGLSNIFGGLSNASALAGAQSQNMHGSVAAGQQYGTGMRYIGDMSTAPIDNTSLPPIPALNRSAGLQVGYGNVGVYNPYENY